MNPFNPSFGRIPSVYIARDDAINKIISDLDKPENINVNYLVYGMRGIGKTVFSTDLSKRMRERSDWIVVDLAMGMKLLPSLIGYLYYEVSSDLKSGFEAIAKSSNRNVLTSMFNKLREEGIKVLITLDEVKANSELRNFAAYYQLLNRQDYPISLVMTGLPENVSELQNEDVMTFLLRGKRIALSSLNLSQIELSYQRVFSNSNYQVSLEILSKMALMTKGYSYAFQLLGYLVWKADKESKIINQKTLDQVLPEYLLELDQNVYTKIFTSLSKRDKKFVIAMA